MGSNLFEYATCTCMHLQLAANPVWVQLSDGTHVQAANNSSPGLLIEPVNQA